MAQIAAELAHNPLDRHLLNWFAERVAGLGPVCNMGCGPGHVAAYLHQQGVALDFIFFQVDEMRTYLTTADFEIEAVIERAPYAGAEHSSRRAYICAGSPGRPGIK